MYGATRSKWIINVGTDGRDESLREVLLFSEHLGKLFPEFSSIMWRRRNASRRSPIFSRFVPPPSVRLFSRNRFWGDSRLGCKHFIIQLVASESTYLVEKRSIVWQTSSVRTICLPESIRFLFLLLAGNKLHRARDTNGDTSVALLRTVTEGKSSEKLDGVIGNVGIWRRTRTCFSCLHNSPPPQFLSCFLILSADQFVTKRWSGAFPRERDRKPFKISTWREYGLISHFDVNFLSGFTVFVLHF